MLTLPNQKKRKIPNQIGKLSDENIPSFLQTILRFGRHKRGLRAHFQDTNSQVEILLKQIKN